MEVALSKYLDYAYFSLADAGRMMPPLLKKGEFIEVSLDDFSAGRISAENKRALFSSARGSPPVAAKGVDDAYFSPLKVTVMPLVYSRIPLHGQYETRIPQILTPLLLFGSLNWEDGYLFPEDDVKRQAILARDLLDPNRLPVSIGTVDAADAAYAHQQDDVISWASLVRKGMWIVEKVSGQSYDAVDIDGYECLKKVYICVSKNPPATRSILRLIEHLKSKDKRPTPLLEGLLGRASDHEILSLAQQAKHSLNHLGQMECAYGLSPSQREALTHHLADPPEAGILTVDGPPGTGKTTLLLSVIATLWVKHALEQSDAPLIVAASTNNQAVTNILRAFSEVKDSDGPLKGRWLSKLKSYGLYLPAESQKSKTFAFPIQIMRGVGKGGIFDAQVYESRSALSAACEEFLSNFKLSFHAGDCDLSEARDMLHKELRDEVESMRSALCGASRLITAIGTKDISKDSIDRYRVEILERLANLSSEEKASKSSLLAARELRAAWAKHINEEPLWIGVLSAIGFEQKRHQRDRVFITQAVILYDIGDTIVELGTRESISQSIKSYIDIGKRSVDAVYLKIKEEAERMRLFENAVTSLRPFLDSETSSFEDIQRALDTGPRYRAFKLATHYWEARYLLQLEDWLSQYDAIVESRAPERLLRQYRRLAKIHPCFVCTLYTLPDKFTAWRSQYDLVPLYNEIDLLIIDEAGQVSPEVGVPSFALAKRALVVGDPDQIEPIWEVPQFLDTANAIKSDLVSVDEVDEFLSSGLAASCGSLMRTAQRATRYSKYPKRGRGMFLSEHRRCWSEIIEMCNVLIYNKRLKPSREDNGKRCINPSVGYVHLLGRDWIRGGSRVNRMEAQAIVEYLKHRESEIATAYNGRSLGSLIAIVTPFSAQARVIRSELERVFGGGHGIVVGTVHALQGAESRIVIFSPTYGLGTDPGSTFMDRNRSILNVAISRAQDAFWVFGNMHIFHPSGNKACATIGRMLFSVGEEIDGIDSKFLIPERHPNDGRLISGLEAHTEMLSRALNTARRRVAISSPFLSENAIVADGLEAKIAAAVQRGVQVQVICDPVLGSGSVGAERFEDCVRILERAGAEVYQSKTEGVHSKLIFVDRDWLVVGSFNWLSAVRYPNSIYARHETSIYYAGRGVSEMIIDGFEGLSQIIESHTKDSYSLQ